MGAAHGEFACAGLESTSCHQDGQPRWPWVFLNFPSPSCSTHFSQDLPLSDPDPHPLSFDQQPFNRAFSTSSRSIRMISIELLDMRSPSMLYFRVFANRQPRKSPDSFLGLSPIPRPRFANSFACHRSKNSPVSPAIATDPKTHVSNPCTCHTSEIPGDLPFWFNRLVTTCRFNFRSLPFMGHSSRGTVHFPVSPFFSDSSALFPTTAIAYLLFIQSVAHSFHCNGGCTPLPTSFDIQTFRGFDVFTISPKVLYFQYHERRI